MDIADVVKNRVESFNIFLTHMVVVVFALYSNLVIKTADFESPEYIDLMLSPSSTNQLYIVLNLYIGKTISPIQALINSPYSVPFFGIP